tara:strand:- start:127 stop:354 length:228 start_codon:yes stop_codon:yes gene_type:complete
MAFEVEEWDDCIAALRVDSKSDTEPYGYVALESVTMVCKDPEDADMALLTVGDNCFKAPWSDALVERWAERLRTK